MEKISKLLVNKNLQKREDSGVKKGAFDIPNNMNIEFGLGIMAVPKVHRHNPKSEPCIHILIN